MGFAPLSKAGDVNVLLALPPPPPKGEEILSHMKSKAFGIS